MLAAGVGRDILGSTHVHWLSEYFISSSIGNKDFLRLAVEDYNACQSMYREELKQLERWVREKRLDKLKFSRQKLAHCHFSAAATICFKENGSILPRQCKELFWKLCKVLHFTSHEPYLYTICRLAFYVIV
ncbi:hypothetical protein GOBAR_DD15806 [Gossypium barbadense]|nr:hypothetical protein GOBAR_DD15806 [Gossypium barbadense]